MLYVLVGGPFLIHDTEYKGEYLGQEIEMPEDVARKAIADGVLLLPKEKFEDLFTAEELAKYPNGRLQESAPPEFHKKHAAAIRVARDYAAQLAKDFAGRVPAPADTARKPGDAAPLITDYKAVSPQGPKG